MRLELIILDIKRVCKKGKHIIIASTSNLFLFLNIGIQYIGTIYKHYYFLTIKKIFTLFTIIISI